MTEQPRGVRITPVSDPKHELEYWLSADLAQVSPPNAGSRLRQLADAQGSIAAGWSSAIAGGVFIVLVGVFTAYLTGNPVYLVALGLAGLGLSALGVFSWKRVRSRLPKTRSNLITRGPGSARGGVVTATVLAALLGAGMLGTLPAAGSRGTEAVLSVVASYVLIVLLLVATIVIPALVLGRSRQSFRRRITTDPVLRAGLEKDLESWRDPYGNQAYGPL